MRRSPPNVFGLAFLDVIACGFGAVILVFMIINTGTTREVEEHTESLREEAFRLEQEVLEGRRHLVRLRNDLREVERERVEAQGRSQRIVQRVRRQTIELAESEKETRAHIESIAALAADLESLEEVSRRLEGASHGRDNQGDALRRFRGKGDRQYLTGLQVGGRRIFLLLDASASMLDRTVVNVVRIRHLSDEAKRRSDKWLQAVSTVDWLTARLPADSHFQIYTFNVRSTPVIEGSEGRWLEASAPNVLNDAVEKLDEIVPAGGTSLHHAFAAIRSMDPPPDNIYLLTDGLPTQGEEPSNRTTVTPTERLRHFRNALGQLPSRVPINVVLFPMEGDPDAAQIFWTLAQRTGGSMLSPSRDWP